jgi:hypothetical protein
MTNPSPQLQSRSDRMKVAVGFIPRLNARMEIRRVATLETAMTRLQASLRDACRMQTCFPWDKSHGYRHELATRASSPTRRPSP